MEPFNPILMHMDRDHLNDLFRKYLDHTIQAREMEELFGYIRKAEEDDFLKEQITEVFRQTRASDETGDTDWEAMFARIVSTKRPEEKQQRNFLLNQRRIAAACLVFLLASFTFYVLIKRTHPAPKTEPALATQPLDIQPGGNKAVLTLGNGQAIQLDSAGNGLLAKAGGIQVQKVKSGQLIVTFHKSAAPAKGAAQSLRYNTLTTPKGGQYQITLADGTKIWLNAASSIRFPSTFTGKAREVTIAGEAYFEVAPNSGQPFIVHNGTAQITVLGTHFNVHAYADEASIRITLLEGSVQVQDSRNKGSQILQPGQQARIGQQGTLKVVDGVALNDVIAWKKGFFAFRDNDLKTIMRKLSRWYDITVEYAPKTDNNQRFSGQIDKHLPLSQVLEGLMQTKARFRIEANRKVIILPSE